MREAVAMLLVASNHVVGHAVAADVVLLAISSLLDACMDLRQTGITRIRVRAARRSRCATIDPRSDTLAVAAAGIRLAWHGHLLPLLNRCSDLWQRKTITMLLLKANVHVASLAVTVDVILFTLWAIVGATTNFCQAQSSGIWIRTRPER